LGVHELDMVLPVGILKANLWSEVATDVEAVVAAARQRSGKPALVKVIIETALLTDREKAVACMIAEHCGADFVKTSTGYTGGGATVEDVALMRRVIGDRLGVKAAGGIRTREQAHALIQAGATRLGTSNGCALVG
jgi:deoxyribose-phosphate aldolase